MAASFTLGAFAVILDADGRVLISQRRDMDAWNLPGGGVETRETPPEAVIREVAEETGLAVSVRRLVGVYTNSRRDDLVFVFKCTVIGGELVTTEESRAHRYCSIDEFPPNISPKHVERVRDAMADHPAPLFRLQGGPTTREWLAAIEAGST